MKFIYIYIVSIAICLNLSGCNDDNPINLIDINRGNYTEHVILKLDSCSFLVASDYKDFDNDGDIDILCVSDIRLPKENQNSEYPRLHEVFILENKNMKFTKKLIYSKKVSYSNIGNPYLYAKWGHFFDANTNDIIIAENYSKKILFFDNNAKLIKDLNIDPCDIKLDVYDYDSDGLDDFFIRSLLHDSGYDCITNLDLYKNMNSHFERKLINSSSTFNQSLHFFDIDSDSYTDIIFITQIGSFYTCNSSNILTILYNQNNSNFNENKFYFPKIGISTKSIIKDLDNDGDIDIFGGTNENVFYCENKGNRKFDIFEERFFSFTVDNIYKSISFNTLIDSNYIMINYSNAFCNLFKFKKLDKTSPVTSIVLDTASLTINIPDVRDPVFGVNVDYIYFFDFNKDNKLDMLASYVTFRDISEGSKATLSWFESK